MSSIKLHILKDMDGVETCWEAAMKKGFEEKLPGVKYLSPQERRFWEISMNYPEEYRETINSIYFEPGFFSSLKPMRGSIEATEWFIQQGHRVTFCTSPLYTDDPKVAIRCIGEKLDWLYEHYRYIARPRLLFDPSSPIQFNATYDKTSLHGDILIDDNPYIRGHMKPTWKHFLFDDQYNFSRSFYGQRINWSDGEYFYKKVIYLETKLLERKLNSIK